MPTGYVCPHQAGFLLDPYPGPPIEYATNNLMGGTRDAYLSPLQMGKINRALALKSIRKYVKEMTSSTSNWVVISDEVWDFDIQTYQNIFVTNGATLTIKCRVGMANLGTIVVDRGAKLVIDGGEIYAWGSNWDGIGLWGTANKKQTIVSGLSPDHGIVQIINGGTIRDANTGISTIKVDAAGNFDWSYTGGIIQCDGANFINNRRAIAYLSYHNILSNTMPIVIGNIGYINRSVFETNSVLKDATHPNPDYFITMYDVEGITLYGNTFQNTRSPLPPFDQRGGGLSTINAGFDVERYLSGSVNVPTLFKNLQYGVYASGLTPYLNIKIHDNSFTNCNRAIYMNAINYAVITKNKIDVGDGTNATAFLPYGIYNDHCQGYQIEQNVITTSVPLNTLCQGVLFNGTGGLTNRLYLNKIDKMNCGATVYGNNRGSAPGEGLLFKCNRFGQTTGANAYDISMQWSPDFFYGLIDAYQGTSSQGANNQFSHSCAGPSDYYDYNNNPATYPVNYYYNPDGASLNQPICYSPPLIPLNITTAYSDNMCASNLITGSQRIVDISKVTYENTSKIDKLKMLLNGGDTEGLLKTVNGTMSNSDLKALLLSQSPYVSGDVLLAYMNRLPSPSFEDLKDIILANSPVTHEVLEQLENLTMPEAIRKLIISKQTGISAYTKAEEQIAELNYEKSFLVDDQIRSLIQETNMPFAQDSIVALLKLDTRPDAAHKLSSVFMANGQKDKAHKLVSENIFEQNNSFRLQQLVLNRGIQNIITDPSVKSELQIIASEKDKEGYTIAKAVLKQLFGTPFEEFISLPTASPYSKRYISNDEIGSFTEEVSLLNVFPNPAESNFSVHYILPESNTQSEIQIVDMLGHLIYKNKVSVDANTLNIDSSQFPKGVYIITLSVNGKPIEHKKLTIQ